MTPDFATGRYTLTGGVEGSMTVFVPGRFIHSTSLLHPTRCEHGRLITRMRQQALGWPLRRRFRIKVPGGERRGAYRFSERATLKLRFFKGRDGTFQAIGSLRSIVAVYSHGRRIDTCRANSVVRARHDGLGPLNDPS